MLQVRYLLFVEPRQSLLVGAESKQVDADILGGSRGPLILEGGSDTSRCHEAIDEKEEPLGTSQDLDKGDCVRLAVDKTGMRSV